jgi:hypothetical protein
VNYNFYLNFLLIEAALNLSHFIDISDQTAVIEGNHQVTLIFFSIKLKTIERLSRLRKRKLLVRNMPHSYIAVMAVLARKEMHAARLLQI